MNYDSLVKDAARYYDEKLGAFGPTPHGVDWNSPDSQALRFEQLLRVCDPRVPFSINDYGCGYGALVDFMAARGYVFDYCGYDVSKNMIACARELHPHRDRCKFTADGSDLQPLDYTIASGVFNVKQQTTCQDWTEYVLHTLGHLDRSSRRGFAFNVLTSYSDAERMRPDLYYADPLFMFDFCKRNLSRSVALLHDYPLYEFTILVRK